MSILDDLQYCKSSKIGWVGQKKSKTWWHNTWMVPDVTKMIGICSKFEIHSPSKCLAWVKNCCHVWLDKNFVPSLLTNKLWLIIMGKKAKKNIFFKKKSKWPTQKNNVFQNRQFSIFFVKISWIGPWVSRIGWCKGHWWSLSYMVVRLFDISSKMAKKSKKCIFCLFLSLCRTASRPYGLSQINVFHIIQSH